MQICLRYNKSQTTGVINICINIIFDLLVSLNTSSWSFKHYMVTNIHLNIILTTYTTVKFKYTKTSKKKKKQVKDNSFLFSINQKRTIIVMTSIAYHKL